MGLIDELLGDVDDSSRKDTPLEKLVRNALEELDEIDEAMDEAIADAEDDDDEEEEGDDDEDDDDADDDEDPRAAVLIGFAEDVAALLVHSCPNCGKEDALCFGCHIKETIGEKAMLSLPDLLPQAGHMVAKWWESQKKRGK